MVSSRDTTANVIGVEYSFHGAHLSYYEDYVYEFYVPPGVGNSGGGFYTLKKADLTDSFVFNPQVNVKLSQGTHPVVYVGAGSHGSFPVGGRLRIYDAFGRFQERDEAMTHTGLVLSTQADDSHSNLWESYNLVVLPEPDPANTTNNMGLDSTMSWLGAEVKWGTRYVDSPRSEYPVFGAKGNDSPKGPYYAGWEKLKFFRKGSTGPDFLEHPFRYSDLPNSYHHWTVIGAESWGDLSTAVVDTVSLSGDIVIFSGATLTINPGTIIEFAPGSDRHQFSKEGVDSSDDLIEIFVYGTLTTGSSTEGWTTADSILFQRNDLDGSGEAWGGIHVMAGGTATLSYTRISDTRRGKPTDLTAEPVDGQVGHIELTWTNPDDSSIPQWEYQQKAGSADWGPWMPMPGSTSSTSSHIVEGLTIGVSYQFKVRGLNRTDLAESDPSAAGDGGWPTGAT